MTMGSSECEKCAYDLPNQEKPMDENPVFLQENNDISNQVLGLTRSHKGREITVTSCPQNQELTLCGTACPKICGQPEAEMCIEMCLTNVCQCPRALWLDSS